ncbi:MULTISPECIES: hypothetical protein [Oceanobacillus]|uniref:Uncharacterized protein n=1 Tax=Oceanobacillus aidingensis TaxID=645964 RepID=A0ABV9K247_9BACI|nr:hypothetical protein [Oceanobacillus oncorhynchi]MDM8101517.1 hypothetical protein [Oceanobacillus oncorhynchi]
MSVIKEEQLAEITKEYVDYALNPELLTPCYKKTQRSSRLLDNDKQTKNQTLFYWKVWFLVCQDRQFALQLQLQLLPKALTHHEV